MLVLVVGPSGAGKDTLLDVVATELDGDPRFRFARRVVTRPPSPTEPFDSVSPAAFEALRRSGGFALSWQAHGLRYGVPADITADLASGRVVVVNVSRGVIAEAAEQFPARVIEITAPAEVLARRLAARGREDAGDVARRLARQIELPMPIERDTIMNDGSIEQGARQLRDLLIRAAADAPRS